MIIGPAACQICGAIGYRASLVVHFKQRNPIFEASPAGSYVIDRAAGVARLIESVGGKVPPDQRWKKHDCAGDLSLRRERNN